jgi:peptide/nickel transport system substrate-binding protein
MSASWGTRGLGRRRLLGAGLTAGAAAFVAACGGSSNNSTSSSNSGTPAGLTVATSTRVAETAQPKPGGSISLTLAANAPLDPYTNATYTTQTLASYLYSRLLKLKTGPDPSFVNNFELEPDLAESYETVGDGRTIPGKLRAGAPWQNNAPVSGRAVNSEDVKFSLDRFRNEPKNNNRAAFGAADSPLVDTVETPDASTAVFKLAKPYGPFTSLIADSNYLWIMPRELATGGWDPLKQAIGSGPFMLDSVQPDIAYKVKKNPAYFLAGQPYLDGVTFPIIKEEAQSVAQFQAGRLEAVAIPTERSDEVRKTNPKATILEYIPQTMYYLAMQQRNNSPFRDERVRRAASMSIDRDALLALAFRNRGAWISSIPANFGSWRLDPKLPEIGAGGQWYQHNPAEAKKLVAAAGFPNGLPVRFNYSNNIYGETFNQVAEATASMLKEGGFDVTLVPLDYLTQYITPVTGALFGNYEGVVFGNGANYSDPHQYFLSQYFSEGTRNTSGVVDPDLDALIQKEEATYDTAERKKLVKDILVYLANRMYYGHTVVGPAYTGIQDWLKNYQRTNAYGLGSETYVRVWVDRGN